MSTPKQLDDGRYYVNIGYTTAGSRSQPKFMLGRSEAAAITRAALIEQLWDHSLDIAREMGDDLIWDEVGLAIAKEIAAGETTIYLHIDAGDSPDLAVGLLSDRQAVVPGVRLQLRDDAVRERGVQMRREEAQQKISDLLNILAARPPKKTPGGIQTDIPISAKYAKNAIKEFRRLIDWMNEADDILWEKPRDYVIKPIQIRKIPKRSGPIRVPTYELQELVTLWKYATPWERCLMVLALNTASGMAEIASMDREEILLKTRHPHAGELHLSSDDADSWIMRLRHKTTVYGEWKLWDVTVQAVEWLIKHRPQSEEPNLVLTRKGKALKVEGQRNVQIANAWSRLYTRVCRDHTSFRKLSFNKIRKTVPNWIRTVLRDDYLADLMLSHGEPWTGDLSAYTNDRWADLHAAIVKVREWLEPVFSSVADPFPEHEKLGGANISRGTIDKIIELHLAGDRVALIGEKLNLSTETARRWIKWYQEEQARLQQKTG